MLGLLCQFSGLFLQYGGNIPSSIKRIPAQRGTQLIKVTLALTAFYP
jgi:hypothetical protein